MIFQVIERIILSNIFTTVFFVTRFGNVTKKCSRHSQNYIKQLFKKHSKFQLCKSRDLGSIILFIFQEISILKRIVFNTIYQLKTKKFPGPKFGDQDINFPSKKLPYNNSSNSTELLARKYSGRSHLTSAAGILDSLIRFLKRRY